MIDDFRLRGSRTCRRIHAPLKKGGWLIRWRIRWRTLLTTPTLLSQRADPSPLWSRLCPGIRTGSELARIPRILCGKASCGAGLSCPRLARRGVAPHRRGRKWREPPGRGKRSTLRSTTYPAPRRGRSLHSDPCGKAVESAKKPTAKNSRPQMALGPREASLGMHTTG